MELAALLISLLALAVAGATAVYNKRNAEAAEGARNAADRAADAAKDSAEYAGRITKAEEGRDHRELAPKPEWVRFDSVHNERTGKINLFAYLRPPRTYLTHADTHFNTGNGSRTPATFTPSNQVEGGTEAKAFISDGTTPLPDELEIRFYPPTESAAGEHWTCPCGAPAIGDHNDRAHWVLRVPVNGDSLEKFFVYTA